MSKAAGHPAHQRCGHIGQALGNAAAGHHVTGKHEEGDCQQGEGVDGAERFLHQIDNGDCACGHNRCKRGDGKSEGDRHTDKQQQEEADQQNNYQHITLLGEDNVKVYSGLLGLDESKLAELKEKGVI